MEEILDKRTDLKKMMLSLVVPASFMFICWIVYITELGFGIKLSEFGLRPRHIDSWYGVLTMPFLHGGAKHIIANTSSFIVLGGMIFYFYSNFSLRILLFSYILSGLLTWLIGRGNIHIGASAMIYSFASYLIVSGILNKNIKLLAVSLVVVFLYGSMIWGIFPTKEGVSWEGHLSGLIVGVLLAFTYRVQTKKEDYIIVSSFDGDYDSTENENIEIIYHYKEKQKNK